MQNYKKYYPIIEKYRNYFEQTIEKIKNSNNLDEKLLLAEFALKYAVKYSTGYFTSSFLENFYLDYAKSIKSEKLNKEYKKNTFLHVLTTGYKSGGHTRVVERWIKYAPENQSHSVVVLNPCENLPKLEENTKEKNGECIYFERDMALKDCALQLRELACEYEYIILHTHMEDPTAVVAFGVEEFKRPVIFYNHASHLFWIGKSISDITLDLIKDDEVTKINRNIKNAFFIGIPASISKKESINKQELRKKLSIPVDKKIIVSSGNFHKYNPIGDDNFYNIISDILDENTYCYLIGPSKKHKIWKYYWKKSKKHLIPMGIIGFYDGYLDYIQSADLSIDSYPMLSWTALMDNISYNIPALSLKSPIQIPDYLKNTEGYCKTKEELTVKAKKVLNDENYAKQILKEEQNSLFEFQSVEAWNKRINELLKIVPKEHKIKDLSFEKDCREINDLSVLNYFCSKKNNNFIFLFIKYYLYKYIKKNRKKEIKYLLEIKGF